MTTLFPAGRTVIAMALLIALAACEQPPQQQGGGGPPAPAVTVAHPVSKTITDFDEYVGRFAAVNSVEIRARVSGTLEAVHFKDGQMVKKGELLFALDRRPFQNTLDQAKANLTVGTLEPHLHSSGSGARSASS